MFPDRYKDTSYHAVCQQEVKENDKGKYEEIIGDYPIRNSWGHTDKIISMSDAEKGIHSRYDVCIKSLTYKGYSTGDIPVIWRTKKGGFESCIYSLYDRIHAEEDGIKDIEKKFFDLCTDFGLTKEGKIIPEGAIVQCEDKEF